VQGVALHRARKRAHEMEVLFEIVEDSLNLGPAFQEFPLAFGHKLPLLFVVRWRKDACTECFSDLAVQGHTPVPGVTNRNLRMAIHQMRYGPAVVNIGATEDVGTELTGIVDTGVQLESVVFTLPIVPGVGKSSGCSMPLPSGQFAYGQHSSIHEAKRCFAYQQAGKQPVQGRQYSMAMSHKVLVGWEVRKVPGVVLPDPVVDLPQCLLLANEQVEDEDSHNFTVTKNTGTAGLLCLG